MIAQLIGTVARTEANTVVLDVNGVGYLVSVPAVVLSNLPEAGQKLTLQTHLIVREDDLSLFGFPTVMELQAFKILLGASGVGPKVALALLSTLEVPELARALAANDQKVITRVPGVGPKLASRMCLELGDRMAAFAFESKAERAAAGSNTAAENAAYEDAIEGLIGLGYGRPDARRAIDRVMGEASDRTDAGALISAGLRLLTGNKR